MGQDKQRIRFNIVDALVVLAVLLVVAGVCFQMFKTPIQESVAEKVKLEIVTVVYSQRTHLGESMANEKLPSQMVSGNSLVADAYLTEVTYQQCKNLIYLDDGTPVIDDDPLRCDIYLKSELIAPKSNVAYKIGAQEVRTGKSLIVKTGLLEITGTVIDIKITDVP